ncbi:MAG: SAF domain-containing protein [Acidimicrobiales bacterium]
MDRIGAPQPQVIRRRPGLPGTRAVVGGLLVALAAIGVFLAYADAARGPRDAVVITRHAIRIGETIEAADLRVVTADLPTEADGSFDDISTVAGRVALGPIGEGEMVQAGSITDDRASTPAHEVALTLPREQVAVGRLKQGERVDVFVTRDDRTTSVVRGVQVVQIGTAGDGSLTSDRQVSIVVAAPSGDAAAALVHALRTGDVTVVRSTFAEFEDGQSLEVGGDDSG